MMVITIPHHPSCFSLVSMPRWMQTEKKENTVERICCKSKQTQTLKGLYGCPEKQIAFSSGESSHCSSLTSDVFQCFVHSQHWLAVVRGRKKKLNWELVLLICCSFFPVLEALLKGSQPPGEPWVQQSKVDFKRSGCLISSLSATCVHLLKKPPFSLAASLAACDASAVDWPLLTFSVC